MAILLRVIEPKVEQWHNYSLRVEPSVEVPPNADLLEILDTEMGVPNFVGEGNWQDKQSRWVQIISEGIVPKRDPESFDPRDGYPSIKQVALPCGRLTCGVLQQEGGCPITGGSSSRFNEEQRFQIKTDLCRTLMQAKRDGEEAS